MANELPNPESRKETYLAKAAGMEVEELPTPASREELYLNAIAENGGGGGGGGTSNFNQLTNRPKYNGTTMTGDTNIPEVKAYTAGTGLDLSGTEFSVDTTAIQSKLTAGSNITIDGSEISATDTTYSAFTGTDGSSAGTSGLVPAPATTDAGKFLKADGTWDTAGGGSSYTAGDGIDITNAVISATNTGKARVLTTADYNWNSSTKTTTNPDCIATWLLEPGLYLNSNGLNIYYANGDTDHIATQGLWAVAPGGTYQNRQRMLTMLFRLGAASYSLVNLIQVYRDTGAAITGASLDENLLTSKLIEDGLTSSDNWKVLSAKQGKFLNGKIDSLVTSGVGAPTSATEAAGVGTVYEDILNGKLYICTAKDSSTSPATYTWTEVGAGGGGVTELTAADYNHHTSGSTDNGVALWLLNDGLYTVAENQLGVYFSGARTLLTLGEGSIAQVSTYSSGVKQIGLLMSDGAYWNARVTSSTGAESNFTYMLNNGGIVQTTGSSTDAIMSQNATTSMIYALPEQLARIKIGRNAANSVGDIAIGINASAGNNGAIAIGGDASVTQPYGVAVGDYAVATARGEFNIGLPGKTLGYNNSAYRLLTGLYDPQSAHDAATKGYVDGKILSGAGAPTTSTTGTVGQVYQDTTNGKLYICTAIVPGTDPDPDTYTWTEVGAGGGGSGVIELTSADYNYPVDNPTSIAIWLLNPGTYYCASGVNTRTVTSGSVSNAAFTFDVQKVGTNKIIIRSQDVSGTFFATWNVVSDAGASQGFGYLATSPLQSTGTSTTEVMSQNATTSMVFADPSTRYKVQIGNGSTSGSNNDIAIGRGATAANGNGIAIGLGATTTASGEMNIGTGTYTTAGYNNSNYRLLTGLYDGQSAHDAATVGQITPLSDSSAPTTATVGRLGQIFIDTTNADAYMCVAVDDVTPSYTWKKINA